MLILGMGTGTYAVQCREYFPEITAEGVEIDEKITALAHEYFRLPEDVPVTTYDGRAFLNVCGQNYDIIMVDAYQDITIPFQMSSAEFFTLVRDHLNPGGVMVVNMNMHSDAEGNINEYLADTISAVFPYVQTVDVPYTTNRELFAAETDVFASFGDSAAALENAELRGLMRRIGDGMKAYVPGGRLLTDDRAPVEKLGMAVIDGLIREELGYYKQIIREDGIRGLIDSVTP